MFLKKQKSIEGNSFWALPKGRAFTSRSLRGAPTIAQSLTQLYIMKIQGIILMVFKKNSTLVKYIYNSNNVLKFN